MSVDVRLYDLAVACKGRIRSGGWWSPWYVQRLRDDTAEMFRLFRALPEPRLPRVDRLMRLVLQAVGGELCGFRYRKERIANLFFALHNLPRAYLPGDHPMCISEDLALEYSRDWLERSNIHIEE